MPGRSRYLFGGEFRHSFSFHSQSVQTVYQLVFRFEPTSAKIDFPGGSDGEASVYNVGDLGSIPGSGSSLEKEMAPTLVLLPRKSHGRRSLVSMGLQRVRHD